MKFMEEVPHVKGVVKEVNKMDVKADIIGKSEGHNVIDKTLLFNRLFSNVSAFDEQTILKAQCCYFKAAKQ